MATAILYVYSKINFLSVYLSLVRIGNDNVNFTMLVTKKSGPSYGRQQMRPFYKSCRRPTPVTVEIRPVF